MEVSQSQGYKIAPIPNWSGDFIPEEEREKAVSPSTKMALALAWTRKPFYEGTVPAATVLNRRRKNKAARAARRAGRK